MQIALRSIENNDQPHIRKARKVIPFEPQVKKNRFLKTGPLFWSIMITVTVALVLELSGI
ncbi:MAG: hypothetical protein ACTHKV_13670 [Flavipsychrobacter sp.]